MGLIIALIIFTYYAVVLAKESVESSSIDARKRRFEEAFAKISISEEEELALRRKIQDSSKFEKSGIVARAREVAWGKFGMKYSIVLCGHEETIITIETIRDGKIGISYSCPTWFPDLKNLTDFKVTARERIEFMKWIQDELIEKTGTELRIKYRAEEDKFEFTGFSHNFYDGEDIMIDDPRIYEVVKGEDEETVRKENAKTAEDNRYAYNCEYYGERGTRFRKENGFKYKF